MCVFADAGIFFIVAYNLLSAIFRGLGDSKSPLLFVLVACIVNIIGDLVLVAGLHMDAAGAAIATVTAQALSVVFAVMLLLKKESSVCDYKERFSPESAVSEIPEDRTSACTSGISDTDFISWHYVHLSTDLDWKLRPVTELHVKS